MILFIIKHVFRRSYSSLLYRFLLPVFVKLSIISRKLPARTLFIIVMRSVLSLHARISVMPLALRMVIISSFSVTKLLRFFIMLWWRVVMVMPRWRSSHLSSAPARRRTIIKFLLLVERRRMSGVWPVTEASSRRSEVAPVTSPTSEVWPKASSTRGRTRRWNCDGRRNVGGRGNSHRGRDINGRGDCHGRRGTMGTRQMMASVWRTSSEARRSSPHGRMTPSSEWWRTIEMGRGAVVRDRMRRPSWPRRLVMSWGTVMLTRRWMPSSWSWRAVTPAKVTSSVRVRWWRLASRRLTRDVTWISEGLTLKPHEELLI